MKQSDVIVVRKMVNYCDDILEMVNSIPSFDAFVANKPIRYAVSMCILQIGELINRLSPEVITQNVQVPWRMIRAMRNVFARSYEKTELDILFETIIDDIPMLKTQLLAILEDHENNLQGSVKDE